jgi:hypothetical protein
MNGVFYVDMLIRVKLYMYYNSTLSFSAGKVAAGLLIVADEMNHAVRTCIGSVGPRCRDRRRDVKITRSIGIVEG